VQPGAYLVHNYPRPRGRTGLYPKRVNALAAHRRGLFSETFPVGQGNRVGLQDDLITCTAAPETFVDPETGEEITFVISVEAFLTPRGR
jgi:hypothetical protein